MIGRRQMFDSLTVEDWDGAQVPILLDGSRALERVEGLAGISTRQVSFPATGRDGQVNRTKYRDGHAISITGELYGDDSNDAWAEYDQIARALAASVDTPRTVRWSAGGRLLQCDARLVQLSPPIDVHRDVITYQAQLVAPDGRGYSQAETVVTMQHSGGGGLVEPLVEPLTDTAPTGWSATIENTGTVPTPALFVFDGDITDPVLTMDDRDDAVIAITGNVAADHSLYVYTAPPARRVLLDDTANRINMVDWAATRWFEIPPGVHRFELTAASIGPAAGVTIRARSAYE